MNVSLYHRILLHDQKGKLVKRTHWKKSHSFVLQFLQHLELMITHAHTVANYLTVKDMLGTNRAIQLLAAIGGTYYFSVFSGDDDETYGILAGTGSTAATNADYKLDTKILHGVTAGKLDYGAHSKTTSQVVGSNVDLVISRTFYNGSGNTITVNEIGISCATIVGSNVAAPIYYFLLARDVITPVDVANAQTLTVQYTIRTTV